MSNANPRNAHRRWLTPLVFVGVWALAIAQVAWSWSQYVNVSKNPGTSRQAAVAVDEAGAIHLVWSDDSVNYPGNDEILYAVSRDGGTTWGPAQNLSGSATSSEQPVIAVAGNARVVAWFESGRPVARIYANGAWTPTADLGTTITSGQRLSAAINSSGVALVAWSAGTLTERYGSGGPPPPNYAYSRWDGTIWGAPVSGTGRLVALRENTAYLATADGRLHRSTNAGASWELGVTLQAGYQIPDDMRIDSLGRLHLAWLTDTGVAIGRFDGSNFTTPVNLGNRQQPNPYLRLSLAVNGSDGLAIAWTETIFAGSEDFSDPNYGPSRFEVLWSESTDGLSWSAPTPVTGSGCEVALGGAPTSISFYAAWQTPDCGSGNAPDVVVAGQGEGTPSTYSISGRITNASGIGIADVTITAGTLRSTMTDANGAFTLSGLPAGSYTLTPSRAGYTFTPPSRTIGVPPGVGGISFVATLQNGGGVCARFIADLTYADGTVVAPGHTFEKRWQLQNCGSTPWGSGFNAVRVAGSFGPTSFAVTAGAAGANVTLAAQVVAPTTPGLYRSTYQLQGPGGLFGEPFWVEVRVRDIPPPDYSVSGRVLVAGKSLAGTSVFARNGDATVAVGTTNADGGFTLSGLQPGSYILVAEKQGYSFTSFDLPNLSGSRQDILITGSATPKRPVALIIHGIQLTEKNLDKFNCTPLSFENFNETRQSIVDYHEVGALLKQGYEVLFANWSTNILRTERVEDSARNCLAKQIESAARLDDNGKVLLVAHSMGGLVSRAYIENPELYKQDVEALITLGTPHVGVSLNTLVKIVALLNPKTAIAAGFTCEANPGLCQLGTDQILLFNNGHWPNKNVAYLFIGGSGGPFWMGELTNVTEGRNDGIVGFRSGTGYQYSLVSDIPFLGKPLRDDILIVKGDNIVRRYVDASHFALFENGGRPEYFKEGSVRACIADFISRLSTESQQSACGGLIAPKLTLVQAAPTTTTGTTPLVTGKLRPGEIRTIPLLLDGPTDVLLGAADGTVALTLTTPDGRRVTPQNVGQIVPGGSVLAPSGAPVIGYRLPSVDPGTWVATVSGIDIVTEAPFTLLANIQSPAQLNVDIPSSVNASQSFTVTAQFNDGITAITGATVLASLQLTGESQVVTLREVAPGRYVGQMTAPAVVGPHMLTMTAEAVTASIARQRIELVTVRQSGIARRGQASVQGVDADNDGQFEALEVSARYTVANAGRYGLRATLQDSLGRVITLSEELVNWAAGDQPLHLELSGDEIRNAGIDGPYRVTLQIVSQAESALMADEQPLIDSLNFAPSDFEGPVLQVFLPFVRR